MRLQRWDHTDNAAVDAMFLILSRNRGGNGEHEGVNRDKMRRNRGGRSEHGRQPIPGPSVPVDRDSLGLSQSAAAPIR
jgi:hypothetical protein